MALNPRQREAVEYLDGPLQVIAGPGTGKTTVITEKVVHLVQKGGLRAENILALTFTDKAAAEMAVRIRGALAKAGIRGQPHVGTFHSFCLRIVEDHAERLGYRPPLRLLVGPLFTQFIKENMDRFEFKHTDIIGAGSTTFAKNLATFTSLCHDEAIVDEDLVAKVQAWIASHVKEKDLPAARKVLDLAAAVGKLRELQRQQSIVTYGDLITDAVRLLLTDDTARASLQEKYRYLLVDEFQDNNRAQFELVNLLADAHHRVLVVGDEDQSIYRFRGARMDLMQEFRKHWEDHPDAPSPRVVPLEENYRSTEAIIAAGQALIRNNTQRFGDKKLRRADESTAQGPSAVRVLHSPNDEVDRRALVGEVLRHVGGRRAPGDVAILCRSLAHVTRLVADLQRAGVAVEVVGGGGLFTNPIVRETIAWLKALDDPVGDEVALHRVLRMRGFGLLFADQRAISQAAYRTKLPVISMVESVARGGGIEDLSAEGRSRLSGFMRLVNRVHDDKRPQTRPDIVELLEEILAFTGMKRGLRFDTPQGRQDLGAVGGLLDAARSYVEYYPFASLDGFVRYIDLLEEVGHDDTVGAPTEDEATVKVMTVHQAKGKEYPVVIVPGVTDRYPSRNLRQWPRKFLDAVTLNVDPASAHEEEERRVLFVAASRAQQELLFSTYDERDGDPVKPSSFLEEMQASGVLETVAVAADLPDPATQGGRAVTREAVEARLHYLLSALGTHAGRDSLEPTLREILRLVGGLLADAGPHGLEQSAEEVRAALRTLGLPEDIEIDFARPAPPGGVTGPLSLSASSLGAYANCPRQFYYAQVAKIPGPAPGEPAERGTAVHAVLERYHRKHPEARPEHLRLVVADLEQEAGRLKFGSEIERAQWLAQMRDVLGLLLQEEAERGGRVVGVEEWFTLTAGEEVTVRGKIDRVDEVEGSRVRVIDYKTGRVGSAAQYRDEDFQLPIYAWAVQEAMGKELGSVEIIGLKEIKRLKRGDELQRVSLPWRDGSKNELTPGALDRTRGRIDEIVKGIRAGRFDAVPEERKCGWCAYRLLCDSAWGVEGEGGLRPSGPPPTRSDGTPKTASGPT